MLKAGYTAVCEFHYLHNQPDGTPYAQRTAMSQALIDAATTAGIGLTLLPTLYQTSDFGGAAPTARQRQFVLATDQYLDLIDDLSRAQSPQIEIGVALHSLRAVPPDAMKTVLTSLPSTKSIHIHIAEQTARLRQLSSICTHDRSSGCSSTRASIVAGASCTRRIRPMPNSKRSLRRAQWLGCARRPKQIWATASSRCPRGSRPAARLQSAPTVTSRCRRLKSCAGLSTKRVWRPSIAMCLRRGMTRRRGAMLWRHACTAGTRATARNIGAIEAGRRADVVVLDTNSPLFAGRDEDTLIDTFVFSGTGHEVRDVMVAGRWLVQEGRHSAETAIAVNYKRAMNRILE
jgi:formimidoylglutamate deiminase